MFWLSNKNNNFQLRTLIWGPNDIFVATLQFLWQMVTMANAVIISDEILRFANFTASYLTEIG